MGLLFDKVCVLQNGKCTNFANDSGKQTVCNLCMFLTIKNRQKMPYKNKRLQAILKITFNDLMIVLGLILAKYHFPQHANLSIGLIRKKHRRIVK